ncbi:DUF2293 domain-containing protein [Mycobacterium sp. PS03-16]|uniref:DUF2293 domain-containing protein n=1 Tax=Mycobacterium sp. PS03-16 TaxID=2559611 RepID=UPI0010735071|nr:DUF2293 domain-containing protein [Mycobacterium sp. PS03-16]TFV61539.1 DUF2293 domain-containing protein [Mycobacterium sp. PS03-16]
MAGLDTRVARIAEAALAERQFVTPLDVLIGLGWLTEANVPRWFYGHVTALSLCVSVEPAQVAAALDALQSWARSQNLQPWDTDYGGRRFTTGEPAAERMFRTRWAAGEHPAPDVPKQRPLQLMSARAWECAACGDSDGELYLETKNGARCLDCADLGHLVFLPSGDAALTRRATAASRLCAVVFQRNLRRGHFERQGTLLEADAIESAARQCLEDTGARTHRRAAVDQQIRGEFADAIREQFPGCPTARAEAIAYHAAVRGSRRARRASTPDAVRQAVAASVRHVDTDYDDLLMSGMDRDEARQQISAHVDDILAAWRGGITDLDT